MARSSIAVFLLIFIGFAPMCGSAEPASRPDLKQLQEKGATIVPQTELKRKLGRMSVPRSGFACNRDACACSGVDDCLDMIESGVCSSDPDKFICGPGAICVCNRH
jgi:hypothetical protein